LNAPRTGEKNGKYNEAMYQFFIDFKKAMLQLGGRSCITFSLRVVSP